MKYFAIGVIASLGAAACASSPPPPPESGEPSALAVENADSSASVLGSGGFTASSVDTHDNSTAAAIRPTVDPSPTVASVGSGATGAASDHVASTTAQPDNSAVNARDRGGSTLTPTDQGGSEGDRKITQQVRQAVMKDGSLSFTAKNVKIITINGKVTLRGPVKTDQERSAIETAAKKVAGETRVDNQIEVKK
ncbi:MAG: BON domain-containing protein [Polyangiaceae bacterium]